MARLQIRRLGYALGAEVTGIDLGARLDDETVREIRSAWLDNLVLCLPRQNIDGDQLADFARYFGEKLDDNRQTPKIRLPGNPYVVYNTNRPLNGTFSGYKAGQSWHSDRSFTLRPDAGTFLLAKDVPNAGGDTMFTNMYLAYETLSPALKATLDTLHAVHDAAKIKNFERRGAEEAAQFRADNPPVAHAVVQVHPESGRRALFVGDRVRNFVGMTEEESRPLLEFLTKHAVSYEFTYRHRWKPDDLVMWDNRCTMHIAISDYDLHAQPRHMIRCCTLGAQQGYPYTSSAS